MKYLLKILLFFPAVFHEAGYAQVNDNFNDHDFTNNPSWSGDTASWIIDSGQLRTNGPAVTPFTTWLSVTSTAALNAQWEFFVNPRCATSSGNYMTVVLMSDQQNISTAYHGYYVMIGNSSDEISLYRKDSITTAEIIDGTDGMVSSSSNNPFRIKIIRDAAGSFSLMTDNSGAGNNYISIGTAMDTVYSTSLFSGVFVTGSASNITKYFFDDFYAGGIITDTISPCVSSVTAIFSNELEIFLNEDADIGSAQNSTAYTVNNGIGNPVSVVCDTTDRKRINLMFSSAFPGGVPCDIFITGIQDISGNSISDTTISFSYYSTGLPSFRDVIISEFFPDPSPVVGLPAAEFIELHNRSSQHFNLDGWTISDGTNTAVLPALIIPSGSYLILCPLSDTSLFSSYANVIGIDPWPSLNNSGDTIVLYDAGSQLSDQVVYSSAWYKDGNKDDGGWSLELINTALDCSGTGNWQASMDNSGGTPGGQNSVFSNQPDVQSPVVKKIEIISMNGIRIYFDESMDGLSLINAAWNFSGNVTVDSVLPGYPDNVTADVFFSSGLDTSVVYHLMLTNAEDCSGNMIIPDTIHFGIGASPQRYEIVINEIFPDPDGSTLLPEYEFIELYNPTGKVLSLSNCVLSDLSTSAFLPSSEIFPNEYLIVCAASAEEYFDQYGRAILLNSFPSLNNSGDKIHLKKANDLLIHSVEYNSGWYQDDVKSGGGWSLEMKDPGNPCGEVNNWMASADPSGGTPGKINSVFSDNTDTGIPVPLLAEALGNAAVIIYFDEIIDSASIHTAGFQMDNGINITSRIYYGDKKVLITVYPDMEFKTIYTLTINGCADCVGNLSSSQIKFAMPEEALPGDIIINEVLFDPRGGGADFVELYNRSERIISLKNWSLGNHSQDTISNHQTVTDMARLIYPGEYLLLTTDTENVREEYPFSWNYFSHFLQMELFPSYSSSEGMVYLISSENLMCDEFSYSSEMHFPLLVSVDGVSLERIDPERSSGERTNWHSASESSGYGTPGYINSQYLDADYATGFEIEPAFISPDNDGYQDIANITYQMDQQGYIGSIVIFDSQGREVKKLMENELLAVSGVITWDGINYRGEKAETGIYIVYFEIFDLSGSVKSFKKTVVLAAKL